MENYGLEELDQKILEMIKDNARLSYKEIGEMVGVSRVAVKKHMDALADKGVIRGYQTVIDETKAVDGIRFFVEAETDAEHFEDALHGLASERMIRRIYTISGGCRIHAEGFAVNTQTLDFFTRSFTRRTPGLLRIECNVALSAVKDVDGGVSYVRHQESEHMESRR